MTVDKSSSEGEGTATDTDAGSSPEGEATSWQVTRRSLLVGGGLLSAAAVLGVDLGVVATHKAPFKAFTDHQAAVIEEATARLVPGPSDDPAEAGHPGAREAGVVHYIDAVLGALHHSPAKVYAGGPFSNRAGAKRDGMAHFTAISPAVHEHWKARLDGWQRAYAEGVVALDKAAGGDFSKALPSWQDQALTQNSGGFTDLLFQHTIEGMYGVPEYGGNRNLVGWHDIHFRGDTQPRGYTDDEVSRSDGPDPYTPTGTVKKVIELITATAPGAPNSPKLIGNH